MFDDYEVDLYIRTKPKLLVAIVVSAMTDGEDNIAKKCVETLCTLAHENAAEFFGLLSEHEAELKTSVKRIARMCYRFSDSLPESISEMLWRKAVRDSIRDNNLDPLHEAASELQDEIPQSLVDSTDESCRRVVQEFLDATA